MGHKNKKDKNKRSAGEAELDNERTHEKVEEERKRKKKEPPQAPVESEQVGGEKKMSKRQMKREKHAERVASAQEASHKATRTQALSYLSLWKHNKAEWKFNKVKQIYLYKHKFDAEEVPDEMWRDFVDYFASASGSIKSLIVEDSKKVIEEMDKQAETEVENPKGKPSEVSYKRARDLIQNINE